MFEHSVKVPRPYKLAANIFKKVATEGGSVKTLLYDNKLRHFRTNALYALITETIKHSSHIDKLFENCNVLANEPRLDPWLAKVLTAELLFGKKILPGNSKPELTITSYKEQFEKYNDDHRDDLKVEVVRRPRYVRINTNLITTSDAIRVFQDEGYNFIRCTSGSYDDYLKHIQKLTEYDFTQDYHVKTVYVFFPGTKMHEHELYLENKIILQDKATTLAVHLLAPPQGSVVLDMCAAPGMKTTQLAAYLRNEGKIYAVERNENRYKTLCDFVTKTGCKCVQTINKDSLEIKRGDYDDVEYILLDPSCSGSGMEFSVHNYIEPSRLAKLTSLQEKFLKHAMNSFPRAKRIVYSTCSIYPEENERVVTNTVKVSRAKWRVQDVKELLKGQWNNFGSNMYGSIGVRCLYAKPDSDFTIGFFLAVLDRDEKDLERQLQIYLEKKENVRNNLADQSLHNNINELNLEDDLRKSHKNKTKNKDDITSNIEKANDVQKESNNESEAGDSKVKKKKKKRYEALEGDTSQENTLPDQDDINNDVSCGRKKKKKHKEMHEVQEISSVDLLKIPEDSSDVIKKGKKKRKYKEHEEHMVMIETEKDNGNCQVDEELTEVSKKKKKKKKHNKPEATEQE